VLVEDAMSSSSRRVHIGTLLIAPAVLTAASLPAVADSTGRYSSIATAKKRYLPRINRGISEFASLKGEVNGGGFDGVSTFLTSRAPDMVAALDLYATGALKKGEYLDKKSLGAKGAADEFTKHVDEMRSAVKAKDKEALKTAYLAAEEDLTSYLSIGELPPIGDATYAKL